MVCAGSFNPAIFHPLWLIDKGLLPRDAGEAARETTIVTPNLTAFTADWLNVQITPEQAVFATVEEGRAFDLRDVAKGALDVLPETPVDGLGINSDAHFRLTSEEAWHELGDRFLPKDFWQPMFEDEIWIRRANGLSVGLRTMTLEAWRGDVNGYVRTEVAPSVRVTPHGVYVAINAHFQLTVGEDRSNGYQAARTLDEHWDDTRELERLLTDRVLEAST